MSQKADIINILKRAGQIDNFYCIDNRLTIRLAMHIDVLRKAGWKIRTEELPNKNCIYHLISEPAPVQLAIAK